MMGLLMLKVMGQWVTGVGGSAGVCVEVVVGYAAAVAVVAAVAAAEPVVRVSQKEW